jgi:hypothetical protein
MISMTSGDKNDESRREGWIDNNNNDKGQRAKGDFFVAVGGRPSGARNLY